MKATKVYKVLFIGNSHTYYNDMVQMFVHKCQANQMKVQVTMLTHGGKSLLWHSDEPEIRFNILYGDYDYVVLQDAAHPFGGEEHLLEGVEKIQNFIKQTQAQTVLYMTWAEKKFPEHQEKMSLAYKNVAAKTQARLAPVGEYWEQISRVYPELELFDPDGQHASVVGSYLVSAIIYNSLFEKLPVQLDELYLAMKNK